MIFNQKNLNDAKAIKRLNINQEKNSVSRLYNLDILRFLCAIMILFYHFCYRGYHSDQWILIQYPEVAFIAKNLWLGVSFFFIISGFVIAYSIENKTAHQFAVSRIARLYPAFLICMTITALFMLFFDKNIDEFKLTAARYFANLGMTPQIFGQKFMDGAYWSIVVEIIFYFWIFIFLILNIYQSKKYIILTSWAIISLINEFYIHSKILKISLCTTYAGYFIIGIVFYEIFKNNNRIKPIYGLLFLLSFFIAMSDEMQYIAWMNKENINLNDQFNFYYFTLKMIIISFIFNIAIRIKPIITSNYCVILGGLTYPLYLIHQNAGYMMFHMLSDLMNKWLILVVTISCMVFASYLIFQYCEPWGRKVIYKLDQYFTQFFLKKSAQ